MDLRDLNSNIVVDGHSLANINEMLLTLKETRVFRVLDLSTAYHQIPFLKESQEYTTFITPKGLFQFKHKAFGWASEESVFYRMVHAIFGEIRCITYFQNNVDVPNNVSK